MSVLTIARYQSVRGVSNYQTGHQSSEDQIIHFSPHSIVSECWTRKSINNGFNGMCNRKVCCEEFLCWIFLQNNNGQDGWEGTSAISFDGSSLDMYEVRDHKKSLH